MFYAPREMVESTRYEAVVSIFVRMPDLLLYAPGEMFESTTKEAVVRIFVCMLDLLFYAPGEMFESTTYGVTDLDTGVQVAATRES